MKYPFILFFRYDQYSYIDKFFEENKDNLLCSIFIINNKEELNKLFDPSYHLLITFGDDEPLYYNDVNSMITERMRSRWLHFTNIDDVNSFNSGVNNCYVHLCTTLNKEKTRPIFSLFTTCFNSYDKILRAYKSIKSQTLKDWEWVILDDSPNDEHFVFLKKKLLHDKRIRLYKRSENNGNIGNVKNEAISLCRGKYLLEMDHDDEILPYVLSDSTNVFENYQDVGFIYMDFVNIYEDKANFNYGDFFALGYSGYYRQKYDNSWIYVAMTPNINNVSLSHIVSVPNHPRIWRASMLLNAGNFCEFLPILDDYEILVRSAVNTKMAKIHKLGYIQYMNNNNNNFSLIRNSEINRIIWPLRDICFGAYKVNDIMKQNDAYEDEAYVHKHSQIWKRTNYEYKYCNYILNLNHKKQYCIIGLDTFYDKLDELKILYEDKSNDFLLLDNKDKSDDLCKVLDNNNFTDMKCYSMTDCSDEELKKYFLLLYKSCDDYTIFERRFKTLFKVVIPN